MPEPREDIVRVIRIYEFIGPRSAVEQQIGQSVHGQKTFGWPQMTIRAATLGVYPDILTSEEAEAWERAIPPIEAVSRGVPAPHPDDEIPF